MTPGIAQADRKEIPCLLTGAGAFSLFSGSSSPWGREEAGAGEE